MIIYLIRVPVNVKSTWIYYPNILAHSKSTREATHNNTCRSNVVLLVLA